MINNVDMYIFFIEYIRLFIDNGCCLPVSAFRKKYFHMQYNNNNNNVNNDNNDNNKMLEFPTTTQWCEKTKIGNQSTIPAECIGSIAVDI